jgi:hypothetical protein
MWSRQGSPHTAMEIRRVSTEKRPCGCPFTFTCLCSRITGQINHYLNFARCRIMLHFPLHSKVDYDFRNRPS